MRRISRLMGLLTVTAMMVPAAAIAQGSHRATETAAGTLPFTGLDLVLLLAGIVALLTTGLIVRRVAGRLT